MGRHKETNKHLPPRLRRKGRNYYYVTNGKWRPLGHDFAKALLTWRDLEGMSDGAATVSQLLENALAVMAQTLKPGTIREFGRARTNLSKAFASLIPSDVEPRHIAVYLETRSAKVAANREIAFFSAAWEIARRRGWINLPNPAIGVERNRERNRKRVAKPAEIRSLLYNDDGGSRDCIEADMVEFALLTGMRESDMLNLTRPQLERDGIRVVPRKTDESTEVEQLFEWTPELRAVVDRILERRHRVGSLFLFAASKGKRAGQPFTVNSFQSKYHRFFEKCGVTGLTWHDIRRTALNFKARFEGKEAAQAMGAHSSITTTEGYLAGVGEIRVTPVSLENMRNRPEYEKDKGR
jgi:integrase